MVDHRRSVSDYYQQGAYNDEIESVRSRKGSVNFRHDYLSCALIEQNLEMGDGFLIAPTTSGYDDPLRVANLNRAVSSLESMLNSQDE